MLLDTYNAPKNASIIYLGLLIMLQERYSIFEHLICCWII